MAHTDLFTYHFYRIGPMQSAAAAKKNSRAPPGGARAVHSGSPAPDRDENPKCNVSDLLRGITPTSMLAEWSAVFRTLMSIAKIVLHKFVGYLVTQASELIWKSRCSATIAWEHTQGISAKDKTSKYTGPRGDWSQGGAKFWTGL
ncbi:MAG: hypothetical protein J3R72DRAFT_495546 [Linnemannia gamsii]|nr:MAG: hypothetical protein J3R72DRAFT_495546 [Linnemannia gamsii]